MDGTTNMQMLTNMHSMQVPCRGCKQVFCCLCSKACALTSAALKQMYQYASCSVMGYIPARTPAPYSWRMVFSGSSCCSPQQSVQRPCSSHGMHVNHQHKTARAQHT